MTKRLVPILAAMAVVLGLGASPASGLAPEQMSYQGVLVQNNGIAVQNGVYQLRFRLFDHPTAAATKVFEQTLSTQVTSGLYNVILSNNATYDLGDVVTQNAQLFMEVTVLQNLPLGVLSDLVLLPRQQLASVPYALTGIPPSSATLAQMLRFTTETAITANAWTAPAALAGLTVNVPSAQCAIEVRAEVAIGSAGGTDAVGVRLEQSYNSGTYTTVRGPVAVATSQDGVVATVAYVASNPSIGNYVYRASLREANDADFELNPVIGSLLGPTESTLSYQLRCP